MSRSSACRRVCGPVPDTALRGRSAGIIGRVPRAFQPGLQAPGPPHREAYAFAVRGAELLVVQQGDAVRIPRFAEVDGLPVCDHHYLGDLAGSACWAVAVAGEEAPRPPLAFSGLRPLFARLDEDLFGLAGRALQIVEWAQTHRYCGRCGTPTELAANERAMRCPACGLLAFPRVAPAIIVRVTRGDEILLARGTRFPGSMYSILAGFVDPGESLEECVHREVREEVGIEIAEPRYWGSQPWPFPHSLMVGFTADYRSGELAPDPEEIADAGWFAADALPPLPPGLSIARKLIDDWVSARSRR